MARINVEDRLFTDYRFIKLCELVGDREKAIGKLILCWQVGQKYWADGQLIPKQLFLDLNFGLILDVKLAKEEISGVYLCGSETEFNWYRAKIANSKKGGEANKNRLLATKKSAASPTTNKEEGSRISPSASPLAPAPAPALAPSLKSFLKKENSIVGLSNPLVKPDGLTVECLVSMFNDICKSLPRVVRLTQPRKKQAKIRIAERPSKEEWKVIFEKVQKTPFLRGETTGWRASFDWLMKNEMNATKVFEGNYDKPGHQAGPALEDGSAYDVTQWVKPERTLEEIFAEDEKRRQQRQ